MDALAGGPEGLASCIDSDAAFATIIEAWFELLADGGDAADLAAGPGYGGGAPPLLHLLAGIQLSDGILGAYTPSPLQEPTHLEGIPPGLGLSDAFSFEAFQGCTGGLAAADAAGGGGWNLARLSRAEWARMMTGCREAWGPSLFLRKAATATGPSRRSSLLGRLLVGGYSGHSVHSVHSDHGGVGGTSLDLARAAAVVMLLRSLCQRSGSAGKASVDVGELGGFDEVCSLLRRALPDGEVLIMSPLLEEVHLTYRRMVEWQQQHQPLTCAATSSVLPDLTPIDAAALLVDPSVSATTASGMLAGPDIVEPVLAEPPLALAADMPIPVEVDSIAYVVDPRGRIGADVREGTLVVPTWPGGIGQCCVCFENLPTSELRHCGRAICGRTAYCVKCLRQHAETVVTDGLYSAPSVRCPSCNHRLATESWSSLVGDTVFVKYRENARALLTYRCAACDETNSYFAAAGASRDPFTAFDPEVKDRLADSWRKFFLAEVNAEEFLQSVLVEHGCGHRCGGSPPGKLSKVFGPSGSAVWISDLERRLAVQVAWLHRFPRQRTPCCGERFCFRCKVSSWHRGTSCQERLQSEKARQAQLCPGCGVPTIRSEGCRKITCVCGRVWEWEGDDSSEEGTFSDDGSEEDEVNQAQTAINLLAMNTKATEDSTKSAVSALVAARADVNQTAGGSVEVPLLLAVQCRHPAAVAALCENGARITRDVFEEVKMISHQDKRRQIEELLRPQIQGDPNMKLPLWVWVQAGSAPAVEALLRNAAHDEEVGVDVLIALHRCRGDEESIRRITECIREHAGEDEFKKLQVSAATRRMLLELRQSHDEERDIDVAIIREALTSGADANAREEGEDDDDEAEGGYGLAGLSLLAMNCRASPESVTSCVEVMLEFTADVNIESDEASSPLLAALRQRNMAAVSVLCRSGAKFSAELLDEVKTLSESSRRNQVEDHLRPLIRSNFKRRLPLWLWVQEGTVPAVAALLQNTAHDEEVDVDTLVALQRCRGDAEAQQQILEHLRRHVGSAEFSRLSARAATRRLLQELREAHDDMRDVSLEVMRETIGQGADANAQEEESGDYDDEVGAYNLTVLQLMVTNTYAAPETMSQSVTALVEAKADVNMDMNDSPLLSAVQHRCIAGVQALSQHGAKVTSEVLEEVKSISGTKARFQIEDLLAPLIDRDKSLRCPLWIWVQSGTVAAVEALLRNAAHDEEVDTDVVMAWQRCRASEANRTQIQARLQEYVGDEEFRRLDSAAGTRRLLLELREAHNEERDLDLAVVVDSLARGANPNAREESLDEPDDEDLDEEADDDDEDEDEEADVDEEAGGESITGGGEVADGDSADREEED